jgi:hypothetical protein
MSTILGSSSIDDDDGDDDEEEEEESGSSLDSTCSASSVLQTLALPGRLVIYQ